MTKRLLVIDDERDIREVAQATLEVIAGWDVFTASSGAEGVEVAAAQKPDAILLDVMMPDMDGPTTFEQLRARPDTSGIPVILLTAKVLTSDRERYGELGIDGFISKPFDPVELPDRISQLLGWQMEP